MEWEHQKIVKDNGFISKVIVAYLKEGMGRICSIFILKVIELIGTIGNWSW